MHTYKRTQHLKREAMEKRDFGNSYSWQRVRLFEDVKIPPTNLAMRETGS